MISRHYVPALVCGLAGCALPALAEDSGPQFSFGTGVYYTTGKYGYDEATDIVRVPLNASFSAGRLTIFGELPWLSSDGPADAATATRLDGRVVRFPRLRGRLDDAATDPVSTSESGVGDATVGITTRLTPGRSDTWAGLTVMATLPVGDEDKGLGTGASDILAEVGLEKSLGRATLSGTVGYTWPGDPDNVQADSTTDPGTAYAAPDDYAYARIGARLALPGGQTIGPSLNWTESPDPGFDDIVDISVNWNVPLGQGVRLGTYLSSGLAGEGTDFGAGVSVSITPQL